MMRQKVLIPNHKLNTYELLQLNRVILYLFLLLSQCKVLSVVSAINGIVRV